LGERSKRLPEARLPNGLDVFCISRQNVPLLFEDAEGYFRHGVSIHPGNAVFDVGAHIGIFAIYALGLCQGDVRIFSFEPIPTTFEVLRRNAERHGSGRIKAFPFGLAHSSQEVDFDYYPHASTFSRASSNDIQEEQRQFRRAMEGELEVVPGFLKWCRLVPPFMRRPLFDYVERVTFKHETATCQLRTASEIIRTEQISQIDLLKIDVEKGEWDVLLGIDDEDWNKIQQIVIEVHEIDNRLEKISRLLKEHGLNRLTVEQAPLFAGTHIFNLYGMRS